MNMACGWCLEWCHVWYWQGSPTDVDGTLSSHRLELCPCLVWEFLFESLSSHRNEGAQAALLLLGAALREQEISCGDTVQRASFPVSLAQSPVLGTWLGTRCSQHHCSVFWDFWANSGNIFVSALVTWGMVGCKNPGKTQNFASLDFILPLTPMVQSPCLALFSSSVA